MLSPPTISPALELAIRTAIRLHAGHARKTDPHLPYVSHVIHVAFLVQAHGFPEEVVIAALLHDTLEDTEYEPEDLIADFGDAVHAIVSGVTETKHLRWEERKRLYLAGIRSGPPFVKAVCCADKLHNLSTILAEYAIKGEVLWRSFSRGKARTLQFYVDALDAISADWQHPIVDAYRDIVDRAKEMLGPETVDV